MAIIENIIKNMTGTAECHPTLFVIFYFAAMLFGGLFIIELKARWRLEKQIKAMTEAK